MDRYADDVVAVLDSIAIDRAAVVGLSMGGYVAFALWRRHRARIRALVLADTRAGADDDAGRERRRQLAELARHHGSSAVADRQVTGLLGKTTRQRHPHIVTAVQRMMSAGRVDGIVGALEAMMSRPDSTATVATIDVPTLVIVGAEDAVTPPKEARALHAGIAGSRLEVLSRAGHLSNIERPAAFNAVLAEFLAALNAN
jgi:pimeloyl-ACP methyl ester carboxylesterase